MSNFDIRQGSRFDFQIITDDAEATSATLIVRDSLDNVYEFEEPFVDLIADFQNTDVTELPIGVYEYQINENYADSKPNKFPDPDKCDGDCEFPTLTICEALDGEAESS